MNKNLDYLENKSIYIIREAKKKFKNPAVLCSWGKDSVTLLYLIKKAFFGKIPFKVIHIDTTFKFPEIYKFRDELVKKWDIDLEIAKNEKALKKGVSPATHSSFECCNKLKTEALKQCIKKNNFDLIFVGIRRDEHGIRSKEHYFSPRDKKFGWRVWKKQKGGDSGLASLQDPEFSGWDLYSNYFGRGTNHVRCHPLLHWLEEDIWEYIKKEKIPFNPLYLAKNGKRYRSLGCQTCTYAIDSGANSLRKIIKEIKKIRQNERQGRKLDKEEIMEALRAMGYM